MAGVSCQLRPYWRLIAELANCLPPGRCLQLERGECGKGAAESRCGLTSSAREQRRRDRQAERLRDVETDDQLCLHPLLRRSFAVEDLVYVVGDTLVQVRRHAVGHEETGLGKGPAESHGGKPILEI